MKKNIIIAMLFSSMIFHAFAQYEPKNVEVFFENGNPKIEWTSAALPMIFNLGASLNTDEVPGFLGFRDGETFTGAVRFDSNELAVQGVLGRQLEKIVFFSGSESATYTIKVWYGANFETLVSSKNIGRGHSGKVEGQLDVPILLDGTNIINIGVEVHNGYSGSPLARDNQVATDGKGNLLYFRSEWTTTKQYNTSFPYNWMIGGLTKDFSSDSSCTHDVYRFFASDSELSAKWTKLNTEPVYTSSYLDEDYKNLQGDTSYMYAVQSVYNGIVSEFVKSKAVQKNDADIIDPLNLSLLHHSDGVTLRWSDEYVVFSDDVEEQIPFYGDSLTNWTSLDIDRDSTYYLGLTDTSAVGFPGTGGPLGFIAFDAAITEATRNSMNPHSGDKVFASIATRAGAFINNDWLISQNFAYFPVELKKLSFWTRAIVDDYGPEKFRVLYSTGGGEIADFVQIGTTQAVTGTWKKVEVELPTTAKRVAINCVSEDVYVFLLDDIEILGKATPLSYNLYCDGSLIADNVTDLSYKFTNLSAGSHVFGVQAVYENALSNIVTLTEVFDPTSNADREAVKTLRVYPNPSSSGIFFLEDIDDAQIQVVDMQGRIVKKQYYDQRGIDLSSCQEGIYFLYLEKDGLRYQAKLVYMK